MVTKEKIIIEQSLYSRISISPQYEQWLIQLTMESFVFLIMQSFSHSYLRPYLLYEPYKQTVTFVAFDFLSEVFLRRKPRNCDGNNENHKTEKLELYTIHICVYEYALFGYYN